MQFYNINDAIKALKDGTVTSEELVKNSIEEFEKDKTSSIPLNAFLEMYDDAVSKAQKRSKNFS